MLVNNSHDWINWINWIWGQHASEVKLIYFKLKAFSICFFRCLPLSFHGFGYCPIIFWNPDTPLRKVSQLHLRKKLEGMEIFLLFNYHLKQQKKKIDNHTQTSKWTTTNSVPVSVSLYLHYINIFLPIDPTSRISGDKCSFRFKELIKCVK